MNFDEEPEFTRDFKKLTKRYKSLPGDLETFKEVVTVVPLGNSKHFSLLTAINNDLHIIKARFFCDYLKNTDKLRIIYAFHQMEQQVQFLEMYSKSNKENHDIKRTNKYLRQFK